MTLPVPEPEYDFDSGEHLPYVFMADDDADAHVRDYRAHEKFRQTQIDRINGRLLIPLSLPTSARISDYVVNGALYVITR